MLILCFGGKKKVLLISCIYIKLNKSGIKFQLFYGYYDIQSEFTFFYDQLERRNRIDVICFEDRTMAYKARPCR